MRSWKRATLLLLLLLCTPGLSLSPPAQPCSQPTGLLTVGDGAQTSAVVLLLLRDMVAADARLARALLELGALRHLHAFPVPGASLTQQQQQHPDAGGGKSVVAAQMPQTQQQTQRLAYSAPGLWPA